MVDIEKLEKRLNNTEQALFRIVRELIDHQNASQEDQIFVVMKEYHDSLESLGVDTTVQIFHKSTKSER